LAGSSAGVGSNGVINVNTNSSNSEVSALALAGTHLLYWRGFDAVAARGTGVAHRSA